MKLLLIIDPQLFKTPDGRVWCPSMYSYNFWQRYLDVFEKVKIAARILDIKETDEKMLLCSGENVEFYPLPFYKGPWQFALQYLNIKKTIKIIIKDCDCAVFRMPCAHAGLFYKTVLKRMPFAVELVADLWNCYAPGTVKSLLRPFIRVVLDKELKSMCKNANGVSYVTKYALQKRYPSYAAIKGESNANFEAYYSSITLPDSFFGTQRFYDNKEDYTILHVANEIYGDRKGHEELIKILNELRQRGYNFNLIFIGDGKSVPYYKSLAHKYNISEFVKFTGKLSSMKQIREYYIKSDLFVFPTKAEGLPRVLIEAMATGLPCLSTPVNGIPELLEPEFLFDPKDTIGFTNKIIELTNNPQKLEQMSANNIEKAKEYKADILRQRRISFYKKLYDYTKRINS